MPTERSTSRCAGCSPLLVLKATMTVPTLVSAARPESFAWSEGPTVAAEACATAKRVTRTRLKNGAEILLNIALIFLLQDSSSFFAACRDSRGPNQRGEDRPGLLSET